MSKSDNEGTTDAGLGVNSPSVRRVRAALADVGAAHDVVTVASSARTASEAAASLGVPLGAIVKSLVFIVGGEPVMALVAGDRRCIPEALPEILGLEGPVEKADAEAVRMATGFAIGGVAPSRTRPCSPSPLMRVWPVSTRYTRQQAIRAVSSRPRWRSCGESHQAW